MSREKADRLSLHSYWELSWGYHPEILQSQNESRHAFRFPEINDSGKITVTLFLVVWVGPWDIFRGNEQNII